MGPATVVGAGGCRRCGGDGDDRGTFDLRNSWQVVVGSLLIPLGVVFILLAWYGAAHAKVDQGQIPYLISGGLIGLGCMTVGGFLFWGHWLYRVFDQADLHHQEQKELLEQLIRAVGGVEQRARGVGWDGWRRTGGRCGRRGGGVGASVSRRAGDVLCDVVGHGVSPGRLCRDRASPHRSAGAGARWAGRAAPVPDLRSYVVG